jgi:hypothetical protein
MPLFRFHRSTLEESLRTVRTITSREELIEFVAKELGFTLAEADLKIAAYGFDARTGWSTYIVTVDGLGVVGFTDGEL